MSPEALLTIGLALLAVAAGALWQLIGMIRAAEKTIGDLKSEFGSFRESVATNYVRADGLHAFRAEVAKGLADLRCEMREDARRAADLFETHKTDLHRTLEDIRERMMRLSGERRTRQDDPA